MCILKEGINMDIKKEVILFIIFSILVSAVYAETETPIGQFTVGNDPPPTPYNWTPETTHNKSQIFTWTEGTDNNGDPISTYICISADVDDDSCDAVNTGPNATPEYAFTQNEPNWDYTWGTEIRNYYVKLTPNDGTQNGTANDTIAFNLTDALPTITGQTSDASNDGDKDTGETITFSMASHGDTDTEDLHNLRVCKTDSINTSGECPGGEYCNEHNDTYSTDADLSCTYVAQQADGTSNTAYFFVCDCPPDDNTCPGQCSASYSHTFYVNHEPNASNVEISPSSPTSSDDLVCNYDFGDPDGDSEGATTFEWYNLSGSWTAIGLDSDTLPSSYTTNGEQWKCEVIPVDQHGLAGDAVESSSVTIQNSPPNTPADFEVQDGPGPDWDSTSLDTHDVTPNLRWTTSDNDSNSVSTYVCIATTSGNRDSNNCDAYSTTTSDDNVTGATGLDYSGTNRTYYVRLTPNDGTENGTALDTQFYLLNSIPTTPSGLSPSSTHNQTPTLSWTATDADDGSVNHWPADTLTYHIRVGTSYGDGSYENNDIADKTGETVDNDIPWGTPGAEWANNTVFVSIWTTDGNTDGISPYYNTTLVLYDFLPDITDVEITDSGSAYSSCISSTCAINPVEHSNATIAVRITATDTDDDCDVGGNSQAYIYLCLDTGSCTTGTGNYSWQLDNIQRTGSTCTYTFSTNKTAADDTPEFFRSANSNYKFYANVSSQAGARTSDTQRTDDWEYGTLKSIDYPALVTLGDGSPTLGQWNNGTSLATMTNWGNDVLNIQWRMTDPTSGADTWTLNNTDLQIDDDTALTDEPGPVAPVYLNGTDKTFEPGSGLDICISAACDDATLNETLATYYHIAPPLGLSAGTYNSTITITIS